MGDLPEQPQRRGYDADLVGEHCTDEGEQGEEKHNQASPFARVAVREDAELHEEQR